MEAEIMASFAQFGVAGLVGWMWLSERRSTAERERHLSYAHRRLKESEFDRTLLTDLVRDTTRAMVALEAGQRVLAALIERDLCEKTDRVRKTPNEQDVA